MKCYLDLINYLDLLLMLVTLTVHISHNTNQQALSFIVKYILPSSKCAKYRFLRDHTSILSDSSARYAKTILSLNKSEQKFDF